jgi:flagellar basal-body rod protein FlgC
VFEGLRITGSGMQVHKTWLDAISDNVANVNTVRSTSEPAFQTRYVLAQAVENGGVGAGVRVGGIELSDGEGKLVSMPDHPLADENGMVRMPDVDLSEQMTTMIMAQRGYQAAASQLDRVRESYQSAIQMGRLS